jgi:hypothetical protein
MSVTNSQILSELYLPNGQIDRAVYKKCINDARNKGDFEVYDNYARFGKIYIIANDGNYSEAQVPANAVKVRYTVQAQFERTLASHKKIQTLLRENQAIKAHKQSKDARCVALDARIADLDAYSGEFDDKIQAVEVKSQALKIAYKEADKKLSALLDKKVELTDKKQQQVDQMRKLAELHAIAKKREAAQGKAPSPKQSVGVSAASAMPPHKGTPANGSVAGAKPAASVTVIPQTATGKISLGANAASPAGVHKVSA